ncbi:MAG: hypothetical protein D3904_03825, partial [Candidatus Electrothrix sp. EH2]|nr:hypothetical protein [Candidatus Electrothrix sp. EH2]
MTEDGEVGPAVTVTANGDYTLNGFAGSPVIELHIRVNSFSEMFDMIRNSYSGRLVDVLVQPGINFITLLSTTFLNSLRQFV